MHVQRGQDPEGLGIALEAVGQPEPPPRQPIQDLLTEVAERRVAEVVRAAPPPAPPPGRSRRARPAGRTFGPARSEIATVRATAVTLIEWVSRLCTT